MKAQDGEYGTELQASAEGHENGVQMLLDAGAVDLEA